MTNKYNIGDSVFIVAPLFEIDSDSQVLIANKYDRNPFIKEKLPFIIRGIHFNRIVDVWDLNDEIINNVSYDLFYMSKDNRSQLPAIIEDIDEEDLFISYEDANIELERRKQSKR